MDDITYVFIKEEKRFSKNIISKRLLLWLAALILEHKFANYRVL